MNLIVMLYSKSKYITIAAIVYLVIFFAFASGLVNSIIEGSRTKAFVVPSRSIQTIGETIVTVMILFMGMFGAYLFVLGGKSNICKESMGICNKRICSYLYSTNTWF